MKLLSELLHDAFGADGAVATAVPHVPIHGVAQDHRDGRVRPGFLFVARSGARFDGRDFVPAALAAGAVAVVAESPALPDVDVPWVRVPDARLAAATLAASFHGHPSRQLTVTGVTGTDGKTTTSFLLHALLQDSRPTGLLSTAGSLAGNEPLEVPGGFTTPEAPEVQELLARMVAAGCTHAVIESSSHGLAMERLHGIAYDLAVWTNLTPEHLDYHGTFDAYRAAKLSLVSRAGKAVLNSDDPSFPAFALAAGSVSTYGLQGAPDWSAQDIRTEAAGQRFTLLHEGRSWPALLPLPGLFNIHNALAALAAAHELGVPPEAALPRLARFEGVPGRMQAISREPFTVIVDFAHTGPALAKALAALEHAHQGRVLLVVGAAGQRDAGKRQPLGAAAAHGADEIFVTEEDSRSEDTEQILQQLAAAALAAGADSSRVHLIPDRRQAIEAALDAARPGDLVLLAGKGHERTLERQHETIPWDEAAIARYHLAERFRQPG
jgi:UDP-N-acetylmuramoyl-L-alanyl-D-glutamate--2,6-diaminopimelate ligase